jgi:hypothetical protein
MVGDRRAFNNRRHAHITHHRMGRMRVRMRFRLRVRVRIRLRIRVRVRVRVRGRGRKYQVVGSEGRGPMDQHDKRSSTLTPTLLTLTL